jgi:hypothetical protein
MFRSLRVMAILSVGVTPGIAAAQLPVSTHAARVGQDNPVIGASDATLDELVRRLDAQEQELSCLRQAVGTGSTIAPCPPSDNGDGAKNPVTVALLNTANRLKLHAGLDTLMVFSTSRPFPSGMPLFLLPESPFGLDTNTFDAHARQSYVGALFSGPELGGFQTGAQILTFFSERQSIDGRLRPAGVLRLR